MNKYRTHNCNELSIKNENQQVKLAGFIKTKRNLGGCLFIDLKDHYGVTQITTSEENIISKLSEIPVESTIAVSGIVTIKPTPNKNLKTGKIEVKISDIQILSIANPLLPFEIDQSINAKEDSRLKYRFLDLRNEKVHQNIVFRAKVLKALRNKMEELNFTEIQTPILTSSSPEGARDFLIPSRIHKNEFYALPQAPQQFKQLLMMSNFDKYYQIAPCFRDEDPRADRSPGEFYQLDFEMSFATQEDVINVLEDLTQDIFTNLSDKSVSNAPYIQIPYKKAIDIYGSDKPDLRNPLKLTDITNLFVNTEFKVFQNKTIKAIIFDAKNQSRKFFDQMLDYAKETLSTNIAWIKITNENTTGSIAKFINEETIKTLSQYQETGVFFIANDYQIACKIGGNIRNELGKQLNLLTDEYKFCFITDFPFFEMVDDKLDFAHNPFSMPQGGMQSLNNQTPEEIIAYQYDLVCNGYELASGAVRNHDTNIMLKAFEMVGYSNETVEQKFGALYNAFQYGVPPHAGAAPGIDRMVMLLTNETNIREVIAFPKNSKARDLLMQAPNFVTDQQLKDVHIKLEGEK